MTNINQQLQTFLLNNPIRGNAWLKNKYMKVYVRQANRLFNGVLVQTIDIANIVVNEKYRGQGHFKNFILFCESLGNVYVEQVLHPDLETMLIKNDYIQHETYKESWYKTFNLNKELL